MVKKLREAKRKKPVLKTIAFPCMTFKQGNFEMALFLSSAKKLYNIVTASRLVENKNEGYQRAVSPSRQRKIANFIDAGNPLPSSVLISFDEAKFNQEKSKILIPNKEAAGWVIDGQHRLFGANIAKNDITLPVVAFIGLGEQEQINQFVTINREQVGVPTSLYYELLRRLPKNKTEQEITQERAADLANALKKDESSPFYNRIVSTTSPKMGQLSLTNFVRKLYPYLKRDGGRLYFFTDEERRKLLNNYYSAIGNIKRREFDRPDSIFFRTLGFGAMMNALPAFLDFVLNSKKAFRVEDATDILSKLTEWDPNEWRKSGTGSAAEWQAAQDFLTLLHQLSETNVVSDGSIKL